MPNIPLSAKLRKLERLSAEYAENSTRISNLLEHAERFLSALPGWVNATVEDDDYALAFGRGSQAWSLFLYRKSDQEIIDATSARADEKAIAAKLLLEPIDEILDDITIGLQQVNIGIEAVDKLEKLFTEGDHE